MRPVAILLMLGLAWTASGGAHAQAQSSQRPAPAKVETAEDLEREAEMKRAQRAERDAELKAIEERLNRNTAERARLEAEAREIRADRARLAAALVETTQRLQAAEARAEAIETRLASLGAGEQAIRRSLEARRGLIGDVLAALQRMGRKPPPAVLVRPEDVLAAVRASILMGAVLPELRAEAEALAGDLAELVRLTERIAADREQARKEYADLAAERRRLATLVERGESARRRCSAASTGSSSASRR